MKKFVLIIVVILIICTLIYLIISNQNRETAGDLPGQVSASGTIEVTEIDISSKISGEILALTTNLGQQVDSGQLLAELDIEELSVKLEEIESGYALIDAQIEQAEVQLENLNTNLIRIKKALVAGASTQAKYDEVLTQRDYTIKQIETLKTQKLNLDARKKSLNTQIENSLIYARNSGWITSKNFEEGELALPGSKLYTLSILKDAYIKVYVNETRIGQVNLNDSAHVFIDSYPDEKFPGFVDFISSESEFTPKNIQTKEERVKLVFEVRIKLPNSEYKLKPGLPADVIIYTK